MISMWPRSSIISFAFLLFLVPVAQAEELSCTPTMLEYAPRIDMEKVRRAWVDWNNRLRLRMKLEPYRLNDALNASAMNWSAYAVKRGTIDHKRSPDASYYDYSAIETWFRERGLAFRNVNRKTFTENIGWGTIRCPKGDCTRAAIAAMRKTQRFFLAERGKEYKPHYESITCAEFRDIGIGFALDGQGKYYLTVHYGTSLTSVPPPLCAAS